MVLGFLILNQFMHWVSHNFIPPTLQQLKGLIYCWHLVFVMGWCLRVDGGVCTVIFRSASSSRNRSSEKKGRKKFQIAITWSSWLLLPPTDPHNGSWWIHVMDPGGSTWWILVDPRGGFWWIHMMHPEDPCDWYWRIHMMNPGVYRLWILVDPGNGSWWIHVTWWILVDPSDKSW